MIFSKIQRTLIYPFERSLQICYYNNSLLSCCSASHLKSKTYFHTGQYINYCSKLPVNATVKNLQRNLFYSQYGFISLWVAHNIWIDEKCQKKFENPYEEALLKRKTDSEQILVLQKNGESNVMTLHQAKKFAFKNDLKLVQVDESMAQDKRDLPTYELMSGEQYYNEIQKSKRAKKEENAIKGDKDLIISAKIADSDLETKIKQILLFLKKKHEVNVLLEGDKEEKLDKVYSNIQSAISDKGRIQTQKMKNKLKIKILPNLDN